MTPASWPDVERRLAEELATLADQEFVVVGEPEPPTEPRRGLLRRRPAPPPTRYVQFGRYGDDLHGECVGATLFGGDWEVTPEQHDRIRELGWLAPGDRDPDGTQPAYPNYWRTLTPGDSADLARMGAGALAVLGVDPLALQWRRDHI